MKNYTLNLTEEELIFIRSALCDKNLKHTVKLHQCRRGGDVTGEEYNHQRHEIGHGILDRIDEMLEY